MRPTSPLTDGTLTPGVYRILGEPAPIMETLAAVGWRAVSVVAPESLDAFYDQLSVALQFPPYFGRNLDALWDSLGDLTRPTAVVMTEWTRFAARCPRDWRRVLRVLEDRCDGEPAFAVILT